MVGEGGEEVPGVLAQDAEIVGGFGDVERIARGPEEPQGLLQGKFGPVEGAGAQVEARPQVPGGGHRSRVLTAGRQPEQFVAGREGRRGVIGSPDALLQRGHRALIDGRLALSETGAGKEDEQEEKWEQA